MSFEMYVVGDYINLVHDKKEKWPAIVSYYTCHISCQCCQKPFDEEWLSFNSHREANPWLHRNHPFTKAAQT